jgi:hypothetical protein
MALKYLVLNNNPYFKSDSNRQEEGQGVSGKLGSVETRVKKNGRERLYMFEDGVLNHCTQQRFRRSASRESGS